jgi:pimeloyl-ACP methyl ester carboxylesterase
VRWIIPCLALLFGCVKPLPPIMTPDGKLVYETQDGWHNEMRHYAGSGEPVLLVHGMAANHYNFDYRPEVSLAAHLQARGFDVWVPGLRGDPGATPPSRLAGRNFDFDDFARLDIPAAIEAVRGATGARKVHMVGHSMGGMLIYAALSLDLPVASGVTISSPAQFRDLQALKKLIRMTPLFTQYLGLTRSRLGVALTRPLRLNGPAIKRLGNPENLDWPTLKGMGQHAVVDLPKDVARQVILWLRTGELVSTEGEPWLTQSRVPMLVLAGSEDFIAPAPDVAHACTVLKRCVYQEIGRSTGFSVDYGHIDIVVGDTAATEVFPLVADFLESPRATSRALLREEN